MWWESLSGAFSLVRQEIEFQNGLTSLNITSQGQTSTHRDHDHSTLSLLRLWDVRVSCHYNQSQNRDHSSGFMLAFHDQALLSVTVSVQSLQYIVTSY